MLFPYHRELFCNSRTVFGDPVSSLDFMPTSLSAVGAELPENLDGIDLMPYLTGNVEKIYDRDLYWRFWNQAAIRRGYWKYIRLADGRELLYDLQSTHHEKVNLIAHYPKKTQELRIALERWAQGLKPICPIQQTRYRYAHEALNHSKRG